MSHVTFFLRGLEKMKIKESLRKVENVTVHFLAVMEACEATWSVLKEPDRISACQRDKLAQLHF